MIKVILWDIDGTLLDFEAASRVAMKSCFKHFGLGEFTDEMFAEYSAINDHYWQQLEAGRMAKTRILVERFEVFLSRHGHDPLIAEAYDAEYRERLADTVVFCLNAPETLLSLKGSVRQFGVTNGTCALQHKKLELSGLEHILENTFISEEVGYEKPDMRFFDRVLQALPEYGKNEIMIVGDSLTSDIQGGNNAGLVTCLYNPKRKPVNTKLRIDYTVEDLKKVTEIIGCD